MALLGVNIDHVATVREARKRNEPDPVWAASLAELAAPTASRSTYARTAVTFRERDLHLLSQTVTVKLNLEVACDDAVVKIACAAKPFQATLVPQRREEVTTKGASTPRDKLARWRRRQATARRGRRREPVSRSHLKQIDAAHALGAKRWNSTPAYGHATAKFVRRAIRN